jgi:malate/lactate dehydrogenase
VNHSGWIGLATDQPPGRETGRVFAILSGGLSGVSAQIVLINRNKALARAHVDDLLDAGVFSHTSQIFVGEFSDCRNADIIVITAGASHLTLKNLASRKLAGGGGDL